VAKWRHVVKHSACLVSLLQLAMAPIASAARCHGLPQRHLGQLPLPGLPHAVGRRRTLPAGPVWHDRRISESNCRHSHPAQPVEPESSPGLIESCFSFVCRVLPRLMNRFRSCSVIAAFRIPRFRQRESLIACLLSCHAPLRPPL